MRIASINLNKGLGNPNKKQRFENWLLKNDIDLVMVQEPWNRGRKNSVDIFSYNDLGGTDGVRTWVHKKWITPQISLIRDNWQEIRIQSNIIHNVYFSAYSSKERVNFLDDLNNRISSTNKHFTLIAGDFNLAPNPEDGIFGEEISMFTKEKERLAFKSLLYNNEFVDSTKNISNENYSYSIERKINNKISRFRCDLALISESYMVNSNVFYEHSVRKGEEAFTDHSGIILDLPIDFSKKVF